MKVKVKFRDTEFGLFEPSFEMDGKNGLSYRAVYLDFVANGIPWLQLVLEEGIRGWEDEETLDESPVYASPNDGVYSIIEQVCATHQETKWRSNTKERTKWKGRR